MTTDKKERKERPIASGVLAYFPDAIAEVANVSYVGNQQHNPGQLMHWARHKSTDHSDCVARHLLEHGTIDDDGLRHTAKLAWRALALLQTELEGDARTDDIIRTYEEPAQKTNDHIDLHEHRRSPVPTKVGETPKPTVPMYEENRYVAPGAYMAHMTEVKRDVTGYDRKDLIALQLVDLGCPPTVAKQIVTGVHFAEPPFCNRGDQEWVYIAGPMRGSTHFNFPEFDRARNLMLSKGYNVISPADMGREEALKRNPLKEDSDRQIKYAVRDFWSLTFIRSKCKQKGDGFYKASDPVNNGIVLLPGWPRSTGASAEFFVGRWLGLAMFDHMGNRHHDAHPEYICHHD